MSNCASVLATNYSRTRPAGSSSSSARLKWLLQFDTLRHHGHSVTPASSGGYPAVIVVKMQGGLGNQFFQYAIGRRLAHMNNVPLKLEISSYRMDGQRSYRLGHYNIAAEVASPEEVIRAKGGVGLLGKLKRKIDHFKPYHRRSWIKEKFHFFDPHILEIARPVFLDGYWQSEKYFRAIEKELRQELVLKAPPSSSSERLADKIQGCNAISVHVRRVDYILDQKARETYYQCSPEYFHAAASAITSRTTDAHFFVFSDDIRWVKENLLFDVPTDYVSSTGPKDDCEDLWLMSLCRHHITANSSYSWWGAWLNSRINKIIVAPRLWSVHESNDRIPEGWLLL